MAAYKLKLSLVADKDLDDLYTEGALTWGVDQADRYYDEILSHFQSLRDNPYLYQAVDEVREGYRRSVCKRHSIYYRVSGDTVEIMAVVKRQDMTKRL